MKKCPNHGVEFNYTCFVCEMEFAYVSEPSPVLQAFRAGWDQKSMTTDNSACQAAYERGFNARQHYNKEHT